MVIIDIEEFLHGHHSVSSREDTEELLDYDYASIL